jgi:hypothetical protein
MQGSATMGDRKSDLSESDGVRAIIALGSIGTQLRLNGDAARSCALRMSLSLRDDAPTDSWQCCPHRGTVEFNAFPVTRSQFSHLIERQS